MASMKRGEITGRVAIRSSSRAARSPAGVIGRSDRFAAFPVDQPITPQDLGASLLHALGIDPKQEVRDGFLRQVPLSTGQVKSALLG